jgi:hypothetical protein
MTVCGCCFASLTSKDTGCDDASKYFMKCSICMKDCQLKAKCAREIWAYSHHFHQNVNVSVEDFKNITTALYCSDCKQRDCFYCGKIHKCKFHISSVYTFD